MLFPLVLTLWIGCAKPPPTVVPQPVPSHPQPFGGEVTDAGLVMPRAALAHLTSGQPLAFGISPDGAVLAMDESGLLGAIGIFRGDTVVTDDVEALIDGWFTESESTITLMRHGQVRQVTVRWSGPPTPPPAEPLTNLGQSEGLALLSPTSTQLPRAVLAYLPASTATPVRVDGHIVGYTLSGPIAASVFG